MNLEKYTQKSQEALLAAQHLAQDHQHQVVEPIHLLLALVQQQDGIVRAIITKASGGTQAIEDELSNELDNKPKVQGANLEVNLSRQTADVLSAAEAILHLRRQVVELQSHIHQLEVELTAHYDSQQLRLARYRETYYEATWIELESQE